MFKLSSQRAYSFVTGAILFALGILGFAFRNSFDLPDKYLFAALVLGFWGLVISFGGKSRGMGN